MADYNLSIAASKVKEARMNFAYYAGKQSQQVYISPRKIGDKERGQLIAECGPGRVMFFGVCFKEDNQIVFATKTTPNDSQKKMLVNVFRENNAKYKIDLRQLGAGESDAAASETAEAPAAQATPAAATPETKDGTAPADEEELDEEGEYRKTKADAAPKITAAIKANPPNREELLSKLGEALAQEKAGHFSNARDLFFQLMEATSPSASNVPPPPKAGPPPASKVPGGKPMTANQLSLALTNIGPRLQKAAAANPARQAEIAALEGKMRAALNAGKLGEAQLALMDAIALVKALTPAPDPAKEAEFTKSWDQATQVWRDCVDVVDGQIEKVRNAMQNSGDEEFAKIADKGLPQLTGNHKTPVMAAVQNVSKASGDDRRTAAAKAREAIASFRNHVLTNPKVISCDEQCEAGFGVKLTIRDEITKGLDALEEVLSTIPGV